MLVLAQVSSMKTRREGSSRPWYFLHCARRLATSGRSCSLACRLFFEADPLVLEEVPDRVVADLDPALRQLPKQPPQGHVRLLAQPPQQPVAFPRQRIGSVATHRLRRHAAGRTEPLRPLHHTGDTHLERTRHRPAAL